MKLITLNTWGAKVRQPFEEFIKNNTDKMDIFCFQEVFNKYRGNYDDLFTVENANPELFSDLKKNLSNYDGYFCPVFEDFYGIATFIRKDIEVLENGSVLIYENLNFPDPKNENADHSRKLLWLKVKEKNREYLIINLHGHWVSDDKDDNVARISQSQTILDFIDTQKLPIVLCGDFNLRPNTKSVQMLEKSMINLIKKYNIQTTRTKLYTKAEKFADYIFVSYNIKVKEFKVLNDEVSDHIPLFLDFA